VSPYADPEMLFLRESTQSIRPRSASPPCIDVGAILPFSRNGGRGNTVKTKQFDHTLKAGSGIKQKN